MPQPHAATSDGSFAAMAEPLLGVLYDTAGHAEGWQPFLSALAGCYPGSRISLAVHDPALACDEPGTNAGWEPAQIATYYRDYSRRNPWLPHVGRRPVGRAVRAETMLPRAELLRSCLYSDMLRPLGLDSGLGLTLRQDGARAMLLTVLAPSRVLDRDRHATARLQALAPHLLRAAQLKRQLAASESRAAAAETMLGRLGTALLIVDAAGRVTSLNPVAEALVRAQDGVQLAAGALAATSLAETTRLRRLVASAAQARTEIEAAPGGTMRLSRRSGLPAYEVLVSPMAPGLLPGERAGAAVVFIRDPAVPAYAARSALQGLHGLSVSEARLMQALLAGETVDSTAAQFGLSRETIRSTLKGVFAKTGTASQVELMRLGARSLAVAPPP